MQINRNNYEKWFVDYLDGILDENSEQELHVFLKANPDLAEELESLGNVSLEPDDISFSGKASLLMENAEDVCPARADYLMIKQMEEGLDEGEEKELAELMDSDPSLLERGDLYHHTRLKKFPASFPGKEKLLRKRVPPLFSGKLYKWSAVAAAALLLFYLGWSRMDVSFDGRAHVTASRLESLEFAGFEEPEIPMALADMDQYLIESEASDQLSPQEGKILTDTREESSPKIEEPSQLMVSEMTPLKHRSVSPNLLHVEHPNAYEAGLRHMMPLYLELNQNQQKLLARKEEKESFPKNNSLIVRGMQLMDKLGGELVHFDKIYDEDGNYVAFNFKTGGFEMEQKIKQ